MVVLQRKSQRFYPTRLAINLTSSMMKHGYAEANENGFIVIETNYRIYAYTSTCSLFRSQQTTSCWCDALLMCLSQNAWYGQVLLSTSLSVVISWSIYECVYLGTIGQ